MARAGRRAGHARPVGRGGLRPHERTPSRAGLEKGAAPSGRSGARRGGRRIVRAGISRRRRRRPLLAHVLHDPSHAGPRDGHHGGSGLRHGSAGSLPPRRGGRGLPRPGGGVGLPLRSGKRRAAEPPRPHPRAGPVRAHRSGKILHVSRAHPGAGSPLHFPPRRGKRRQRPRALAHGGTARRAGLRHGKAPGGTPRAGYEGPVFPRRARAGALSSSGGAPGRDACTGLHLGKPPPVGARFAGHGAPSRAESAGLLLYEPGGRPPAGRGAAPLPEAHARFPLRVAPRDVPALPVPVFPPVRAEAGRAGPEPHGRAGLRELSPRGAPQLRRLSPPPEEAVERRHRRRHRPSFRGHCGQGRAAGQIGGAPLGRGGAVYEKRAGPHVPPDARLIPRMEPPKPRLHRGHGSGFPPADRSGRAEPLLHRLPRGPRGHRGRRGSGGGLQDGRAGSDAGGHRLGIPPAARDVPHGRAGKRRRDAPPGSAPLHLPPRRRAHGPRAPGRRRSPRGKSARRLFSRR